MLNEIKDFFKGLFSVSDWPPRWFCGEWSDFHGWLYIFSDIFIWLAYFTIPVIIISFFYRKKTILKYPAAYILFAAFILFCGTTHLMDALMFWQPMYRLNALIRFGTAVASVGTVFYLVKILPEAFKLKTTSELELEVERRILAEKQLEEANRHLQAFAFVASHDLQEPLRKIATFSSILADNNKDVYDDKSKQLYDKIATSAQRLQLMISELLKLSSLKEDVIFEAVDPKVAVQYALEDLEVIIKERQAKLTLTKTPTVMGHMPYLKQLFVNLLANAIKFNDQTPEIIVSGTTNGDMVDISVTDNGIGMNEESTDKIFNIFHRLHSRDKYAGSGIGLALCRRIVDIHKGKITVKSREGEGTTFIVSLPAAK